MLEPPEPLPGYAPVTREGPCPACGNKADPYGDHQIGCGGNGDRIHRHNSIRDALFLVAQTAALAPRKYALEIGEGWKMAAHAEECREIGITFVPLVVETLGGWCEGAVHTIRDIGKLQGLRLGISPAECTRHLFQRLAISLWKGNASLWLNHPRSS